MIIIPGYQTLTQLYESTNSLIYRGNRTDNGESSILKVLKAEYPTLAQLTRYQQEYEITRRLNLPGVVKVYKLEKYQNTLVMILEDFGGQSLKLLMQEKTFTVTELLSLAITITDIIGKIHAAQIIHKDLNPSNIVLNSTTGLVKLIDFGVASILPREKPVIKNPEHLEGTLAYMSPEQTGRLNRAIDYRTDYYALGVTCYELLTHQLPFETTAALELVHCHLAKQPVPPHELNPNIPPIVSDLVMKLLAKLAEERYQSAWGIKSDLTTCLSQLQAAGHSETFALGRQDIAQTFHLSQKLYGREEEVKILRLAFAEVSQGPSRVMLITGYAGIGKTVLVQEVYKPLTQKHGYFMAGKFDPLQRNVPYSAVVCAFRELVRQLLTESETQLTRWQAQLLAALGPNGQVIIEVIPEVALLVGQQPPVQTLGPQENQNRFNLVFHNFLQVFCQPEHPLVIFLDDLQWADAASLQFITRMMTNSRYLFLIGAYRDNEVSATHPLLLTVAELQQVDNLLQILSLSPLNFCEVSQVIADTCWHTPAMVEPLAALVLEKTKGNPFFMSEFLKSLYVENLLICTPPTATDRGGWQWDLAKIQARDCYDNVIDLMIHQVQKLKRRTQRVLKLAACIGNRFNLLTLATVSEISPPQTAAALWQAAMEGLVLAPPGTAFLNLEVVDKLELTTLEYQFAHDHIRQAVYSLIPPAEKQMVHWQVGQLLLNQTPTEQRDQQIFAVVDHLNLGRILTHSQLSRGELASLNLIAGRKAKAMAAYQPASCYLQIGLELLGENRWQQQYELTFALYVESIEIAYLNGHFEQMEQLATVVLQSANTLLDKVKVYEIQIQTALTRNHSLAAVKIALSVLNWLGVRLPQQPHQGQVLLSLLKLKLRLRGKRIKDLDNLPPMKDPVKQAAMRILTSVAYAADTAVPKLFPLIVFHMVLLSIKHGNALESPFAYSLYGLVLCGKWGDIDTGYQFGLLALRTVERLQAKTFAARIMYIVNGLIKPWQRPVKEILSPLWEAYQQGLESGSLEYAALSLYTYTCYAFLSGKELSKLEAEMAAYHETLCQLKQETILRRYQAYWQVVLNLRGHTDNPRRLVGAVFNEEKMLICYLETKDRGAIFHLYFNRLILSYLFGEYSQAVANAFMAEQHLDGVTAWFVVPLFHFYDSLAYLAVFQQIRLVKRPRVLKKITANQKKLQQWALQAPMNHLHKFYLVEAELNRVLGKEKEAREYYDQAIALAHQHEYLNEEALAYELTGKFYWGRQQTQLATYYLCNAHYAYSRWGALAKVKDLETQYEQIFRQLESFLSAIVTTKATISTKDKSAPVTMYEVFNDDSPAVYEEITPLRGVLSLLRTDTLSSPTI